MTNKDLMYNFISYIHNKKLLTKFLKNIFKYSELSDINYIFRVSMTKDCVIMDVFDNISENRFNRYFFDFAKGKYVYKVDEMANIFVSHINVLNVKNNLIFDNNLLKLAYLFKLSRCRMINYAKKFLDQDFVVILKILIENK